MADLVLSGTTFAPVKPASLYSNNHHHHPVLMILHGCCGVGYHQHLKCNVSISDDKSPIICYLLYVQPGLMSLGPVGNGTNLT